MKIFSSSLLFLLLVKLSSAQTFCDSSYSLCDSVSITSVTFIDDEIYGDKLIFRIQTNHANLYAPNFIICSDNESLAFEDPSYGFFSIMGPTEVQLLYYFTEFDITDLPELSGRIINDNSSNEFPNCEMSFNVIVDGTEAILGNEIFNNIIVYPNPAHNEVEIINNDKYNTIKNVIFTDINSKIINVYENNHFYNISRLYSGLYFIEIELQNGNLVKKKLLKL